MAAILSAYGRPLLELSRELGKHAATFHRWREAGVLDINGVRHRLFMTRVGGRWYVRDEDLSRFFEALASRNRPDVEIRSSATRTREADRTTRELDRIIGR
jgi:hypothetical protein